ncbi:hypothetical protein JRO89_XSUnG0180200 [Xanthoceras sorbifolium]|uniref:Retrotransposon gag domain-containing protein n=1 Tax=Xanthoceras sorbifolium TaxID=99658 RepID=A0ABQ8GY01_9ROSI|nr:hypothetical protein JRO89_XSUnG0180200 [Xanthoceras sorbifolium]
MKDLTMGLQTLDAKVEQQIWRNQLPPPSIPLPSPVGQCSQVPLTQNFTEAALQLKSMRLDVPHDDALDWFDWMSKNHLIFGWPEFLVAIEIRFGPSEYEDHFGKLSKLVQSNALVDYQHQFEQLANKIPGVPDHALVSCFVSGLRNDLRKEIQVYKPQSLIQAMGLAQLDDDKCKGRLFLFMVDDDSSHDVDDPVDVPLYQELVEPITKIPEISLHVMAGQPCPRTLRIKDRFLVFGCKL